MSHDATREGVTGGSRRRRYLTLQNQRKMPQPSPSSGPKADSGSDGLSALPHLGHADGLYRDAEDTGDLHVPGIDVEVVDLEVLGGSGANDGLLRKNRSGVGPAMIHLSAQ